MGYRKLTIAERILGVVVSLGSDGRDQIANGAYPVSGGIKVSFNIVEIENGYLVTFNGNSEYRHVQETYHYEDLKSLGDGIVAIKAKHKIVGPQPDDKYATAAYPTAAVSGSI